MASLLRLKDKYVKDRLQGLSGLSCSSVASTSVVASTGRAIDRHSPCLRDPHRRLPPSVPKPPRPSSSPFSSTKDSSSLSSMKQQQQQLYRYDVDGKDKRRKKKSAAAAAGSGSSSTSSSEHMRNKKAVQLQQVSPASSSRFLLNSSRLMMQSDDEITVVDSLPPLLPPRPSIIDADADDMFPSHGDAMLPVVPSRPQLVVPLVDLFAGPSSASGAGTSSSSSDIGRGHVVAGDNTVMTRSCSTRTGQHQVVVLRVSLHCKGVRWEGEEAHLQDGRCYFFRHRHPDEEGDGGGRRDAARRPQQHLQGQERPVLAGLLLLFLHAAAGLCLLLSYYSLASQT